MLIIFTTSIFKIEVGYGFIINEQLTEIMKIKQKIQTLDYSHKFVSNVMIN